MRYWEPLRGELVDRYLTLLGVPRRPPGPAALAELVGAHLCRVPFENVSKLYRHKALGLAGLPPVEMFLDGIAWHGFGGTCYANNCHLWSLLRALGYDARLCAADMRRPDVHAVVMVGIGGREYLVDAGYGAPLLAPLALDVCAEQVVAWGTERYVLLPRDRDGRSRLLMCRDGVPVHGYLAKPLPRTPADFAGAIADSFHPDATFMNAVVCRRFDRRRSLVVHNLALTEATAGSAVARTLDGRAALARVLVDRFGMPAAMVDIALTGLPRLRDAWG